MIRTYRTTSDKLDNALVSLQDEGYQILLPLYGPSGRDWVITFDDRTRVQRDGTPA